MQLEPTSERMVVEHYQSSLQEYLIYLFHQATYDFAETYVRDRRVLDFGCGSGYGSAQMAACAHSLLGVDIASDAIAHARQHYPRNNLRFECISADTVLPFADSSFDTILSFQVFEHVRHPARYLAEIRRLLTADGTLVLATPDRSTRLFRFQKPWNRWHLKEYSERELKDILGRNFDDVQMFRMSGRRELIDTELRRCAKLRLLLLPFTLPFVPDSMRFRALSALRSLSVAPKQDVSPKQFPYDKSDITISANAAPSVNLIAVARP